MSFLSTNAQAEKKTVLKSEIFDLKANIKINKEIIQGFFSDKNFKEKINTYLKQYKQENENLYNQKDKLIKTIQNLTSKLSYNEQIFNETISQARDESEKLKTKLFTIEQNNKKKENIILVQRKKIEQLRDDFSLVDREIFVTEPYKAIIQINDELLLYKDIYENFKTIIKRVRDSIQRYETLIHHLQLENQNLRNQYKNHVFTSNKEKDKLIFTFTKKKNVSLNRLNTDNGKKIQNNINNINNYERPKTLENFNHLVDDRKFENDEFLEFMKMIDLTQKEYDILFKEKRFSKIFELIDVLYTNFIEKNVIISLLEKENDDINQKNFQLNKDNMSLFQENLNLKEELNNLKGQNLIDKKNKVNKTEISDESLINNTSKIIPKSKIQNTISTYQKFLINQQLENKGLLNLNIKNEEKLKEENSKPDSIIYTKNINDNDYNCKLNESNGNSPEFKLIKPIKFEENKEEEDSILSNKKENEKSKNEKLALTLASITSSEFREGCKGIDSFLSTIKKNSTLKNNDENKNGITIHEDGFDFWNENFNIKEV